MGIDFEALLGRRRPSAGCRRRARGACLRPWWQELGFDDGPPRSLASAEAGFRRRAAAAHPDRGGSVAAMQRLVEARAEARRHYPR